MPFRPDVDLTGFIADYEPWLDGTRMIEQAPSSAEPPVIPQRAVRKGVVLVHNGPVVCSSSTALDIPNRVIWDVNGWYAMLGADPHSDRKGLREAYITNRCWESDYATYVLQQLSIPEVRREYDAMPLGSRYLADEFVQRALKAKIREEAARRARETNTAADVDAVADEMGYEVVRDDTPREIPGSVGGADYGDLWAWSYFLDDVECHDWDRLAEWQTMLITALSEAGATLRFAVGFTSQKNDEPQGFTRIEEASIMVAYLGSLTDPSRALAGQVAENLITQNTP